MPVVGDEAESDDDEYEGGSLLGAISDSAEYAAENTGTAPAAGTPAVAAEPERDVEADYGGPEF